MIFLDHASTGDGIVAALQVMAILVRTGKPLSELAKRAMSRVPQVLESLSLPRRLPLSEMKKLGAEIRRVEKALADDGRVLVRWSGTEAKLRIMVEGPNDALIRAYARAMGAAAKRDASL